MLKGLSIRDFLNLVGGSLTSYSKVPLTCLKSIRDGRFVAVTWYHNSSRGKVGTPVWPFVPLQSG